MSDNVEWPDETRIDIIGQNGNTAEHYPAEPDGDQGGEQ